MKINYFILLIISLEMQISCAKENESTSTTSILHSTGLTITDIPISLPSKTKNVGVYTIDKSSKREIKYLSGEVTKEILLSEEEDEAWKGLESIHVVVVENNQVTETYDFVLDNGNIQIPVKLHGLKEKYELVLVISPDELIHLMKLEPIKAPKFHITETNRVGISPNLKK